MVSTLVKTAKSWELLFLCFQAFPEALLHQLILAMAHPDSETRVWAHRIFSVVLMPSVYCPWSDVHEKPSLRPFGYVASGTASQKKRNGSFSMQDESKDKPDGIGGGKREGGSQNLDEDVKRYTICPSCSHTQSFKPAPTCIVTDRKKVRT